MRDSLTTQAGRLWTPRSRPGTPILSGRVALTVTDHRGKVVARRKGRNAVLPWLPYQLWSLMRPYNSWNDVRYTDGTLVYPCWTDIFGSWQTSSVAGGFVTSGIPPASNADGSYKEPAGPSAFDYIAEALIHALYVGNFTGTAPTGNVSAVAASTLNPYSVTGRALPAAGRDKSIGNPDTVHFGPSVASSAISGVAPPAAQTTVTITFNTAVGTVNAVGFLPMSPEFAANNGTTVTLGSNYLRAQAAGTPTPVSFQVNYGAASGAPPLPFTAGTDMVVFSSLYVASQAVVIPTGGQLTVSYTLAVAL